MVADHIHQQHRRNVETWRAHVIRAIHHLDGLLEANRIYEARQALRVLERNIHEAQN